eukprot:sb/3474714/
MAGSIIPRYRRSVDARFSVGGGEFLRFRLKGGTPPSTVEVVELGRLLVRVKPSVANLSTPRLSESREREREGAGCSEKRVLPGKSGCPVYRGPVNWGAYVIITVQSDPDLVTPRFSDRINFPRYRKLTRYLTPI